MTSSASEPRVIPAQLSFLAIYNPSLGPTDETVQNQVVYYYSRAARAAAKISSTRNRGSEARARPNGTHQDELREEQNERLRQIGLAQGMVNFGRTFSDGEPVESVETEKSRIVIRELEEGWWVLASIDLTRLPKAAQAAPAAATPSTSPSPAPAPAEPAFEYSAREVSPPALLLAQIHAAHRTFCLHHGPSLTLQLTRNGRDKLCDALDRFWSRFCRYWEVLLHGNPAVDVLGGIKLAAGGELGMGVGEEEWGSSERDVLEDLVHRTDGLVDLVVSRFGDAPTAISNAVTMDNAGTPWIGRGLAPQAEDGLIFGGVGSLSRAAVRSVSDWTEQIFVYGDLAYGVKDNPLRKRRKLQTRNKRRPPAAVTGESQDDTNAEPLDMKALDKDGPLPLPIDRRPAPHDKTASNDRAPHSPSDIASPRAQARPGIPPPIVTAAEQSLNKTLSSVKANDDAKTQQPASSHTEQGSMFGISSDKWVKYLTLGLSEIKKSSPPELRPGRPTMSQKQSTVSVREARSTDVEDESEPAMRQLEPVPDGFLIESRLAEQRLLETNGYFLIGYQGSLAALNPAEADKAGDASDDDAGERLLLRTVHVERVTQVRFDANGNDTQSRPNSSGHSDGSSVLTFKNGMTRHKIERLRVVVYIRQPFIYAFLFEQRTASLQMSSFYSGIHAHLAPLLRSMNSSTSAANVARRIEDSREEVSDPDPNSPVQSPSSARSRGSAQKQPHRPVYDLLHDPVRMTVHSSIPNIPDPGTHAAEGLTSPQRLLPPGLPRTMSSMNAAAARAAWTRIEALNVHSQILSALESTARDERQIERSCKTSRGWWVVWMRLPPSGSAAGGDTSTSALAPSSDGSDSGHGQGINAADSTPGIVEGSAPASSAELSRPTTDNADDVYETASCRVAIVVRKASDWVAPRGASSAHGGSGGSGGSGSGGGGGRLGSGMFGLGLGSLGEGSSAADDSSGGSKGGSSSLAGGVGFDARRYVEALLSLSR